MIGVLEFLVGMMVKVYGVGIEMVDGLFLL